MLSRCERKYLDDVRALTDEVQAEIGRGAHPDAALSFAMRDPSRLACLHCCLLTVVASHSDASLDVRRYIWAWGRRCSSAASWRFATWASDMRLLAFLMMGHDVRARLKGRGLSLPI